MTSKNHYYRADFTQRYRKAEIIDFVELGKGEETAFVNGCLAYNDCFTCSRPIEQCLSWHPELNKKKKKEWESISKIMKDIFNEIGE
jgi:hypothetical protein